MQIRNTEERYGAVHQFFHWVMAIAIIGMIAVGLYMEGMEPSPDKWQLYGLHKAMGVTLLIAVVLRLGWRFMNPVPKEVDGLSRMQRLGGSAAHWGLYLLLLALPLSGWLMSSAGGHAVSLWGLEVPALVEKDKALGGFANDAHGIGGWVLVVLISTHVLAALWHQFIRKDGLLTRMLPNCSRCKDVAENEET